jgi:hypothetical protein
LEFFVRISKRYFRRNFYGGYKEEFGKEFPGVLFMKILNDFFWASMLCDLMAF